jgi:hypothetical protein
VWSWLRRQWPQRAQTFSMPLVRKDIFTGAVDAVVSSNTLNLTTAVGSGSLASYFTDGRSYYAEVIGGDHEGHRWDIIEAQSTATSIRLDTANTRSTLNTAPATLAAEIFPPARFTASGTQNQADRIVFQDRTTGILREIWLFTGSGTPRWVLSGDALLRDQGTRVVDAAEGFFLHARGTPVSLPQAGIIRTNSFICPLRLGMTFVGSGWPVAQSTADRGMVQTGGFTANANAAVADRIHVWRGDAESFDSYLSYSYMDFGGSKFWDKMGDADLLDEGTTPLFQPYRASLIICRSAVPSWTLLPPSLTP